MAANKVARSEKFTLSKSTRFALLARPSDAMSVCLFELE
jgi:hypothetical protein